MITTVQQVASQMKLIFSEYGWPETIISNNRPCYSAETFTKLMTDYSVNHVTSFPHYPRLNGLACGLPDSLSHMKKCLFHQNKVGKHTTMQVSHLVCWLDNSYARKTTSSILYLNNKKKNNSEICK